MKKVIHLEDHRTQLVCDNLSCKHELPEGSVQWGPHLIGLPCPKCGENMLTERDYHDSQRMFRRVAWINKWFGWLGSEKPDHRYTTVSVRNHAGQLIVREEE